MVTALSKINPTEQRMIEGILAQAKSLHAEPCNYLRPQVIPGGYRYLCDSPNHPERPEHVSEEDYREISIAHKLPFCLGIYAKRFDLGEKPLMDNKKCSLL